MLKFIATIFLLFGCFALGLALYYGKKSGIIKVFNEVRILEKKDEFKESLPDEYGYEDEIYEDISSEDLRNARIDESENLSRKGVSFSGNKKKEEKKYERNSLPNPHVKNTAKNINDETSFMDAETSFMDNQEDQSSIIANEESTSFINASDEEETSFMQSSINHKDDDEETSFIENTANSESEETIFMEDVSPVEKREIAIQKDTDDEETSFMNLKISIDSIETSAISDDEETSFM